MCDRVEKRRQEEKIQQEKVRGPVLVAIGHPSKESRATQSSVTGLSFPMQLNEEEGSKEKRKRQLTHPATRRNRGRKERQRARSF